MVLAFSVACLPVASAQTPATPPGEMASDAPRRPELQELLPQARLVGKGRLTFLGLNVYDARLWVLPGFKADAFASHPLALELDYFRGFDNTAVADRSITEMRRSATVSDELAEQWRQALVKVLPNVKKGDRVLGVNRPGVGAAFWINGKPLGEIRDPEFARRFFGIWLSSATSEPRLRTALLSGAGA